MSVTGQFVTVRSVPAPGPAVGLSVAGGAPVVGVQYDAVPSLQIEYMCSRNKNPTETNEKQNQH